jgi:hypothetical protein
MTMPGKQTDGFDSLPGMPTAQDIASQTRLVAQFAPSPSPSRRRALPPDIRL